MPHYNYRCPGCGKRREVFHSMNDRPAVVCECSRSMHKVISACNIIVGGGLSKSRVLDHMKAEGEMRAELRRDYGIDKISPMGGASISEVYRDVKGQGTLVTDQMALSKERNEAKRDVKTREWKAKAQKRATKRREEMRQRKEEAAAVKRKIVITTSGG